MKTSICRYLVNRWKVITFGSDMLATRFSLAIGAILWAIFLFWPGNLFTPARTTYHLMAEIMSENAWATLFLIQGIVAFVTLFGEIRNRWTLVFDASLGCALWTSSTIACFLSHYHGLSTYQPPAAMSYEVLGMVSSWWHLVRHWAEDETGNNAFQVIVQEFKAERANATKDKNSTSEKQNA